MGFFSRILEKLGIGEAKAAGSGASPAGSTATGSTGTASSGTANAPGTAASPAVQPVSMVDVEAQMEARAKQNPQKLNWRTSIVDLLKLLDIDSSLDARKELARELGCPDDQMGDSAKMNIWLHKAVLKRIAANGGKVPADLLD